MADILVTDGEQRAALATVRSLGQRGHSVFVCSSSGRSIAGASRFCVEEKRVPDPLSSSERFAEAVTTLVRNLDIDVLIPVSEASLLSVLPARDAMAPARIPFPSFESFRDISEKALVLQKAREVGITDPTIGRADAPSELLESELVPPESFPLVLKPLRSVVHTASGSVKTSVRHAATPAELRAVALSMSPEWFPLLVQKKVEGPGLGVFLMMGEEGVLASFGHRRLREKPPSGGVSVLRESVPVPDQLLAQSEALLRAFAWEGVAMVEYKLDSASGDFHLMEINGRLWGSLQLAIDAGVDFPSLLVDWALGKPLGAAPQYSAGVHTRWLLGDLDHLLARMRRSREELALGDDAPGRVRVALDFLKAFSPRVRHEVFKLSDPSPGLRELRLWIADSVGSRSQEGTESE